MVFNNIHSQHINNGTVIQLLSDNERRLYEERIRALEEEVLFLRSLVKLGE